MKCPVNTHDQFGCTSCIVLPHQLSPSDISTSGRVITRNTLELDAFDNYYGEGNPNDDSQRLDFETPVAASNNNGRSISCLTTYPGNQDVHDQPVGLFLLVPAVHHNTRHAVKLTAVILLYDTYLESYNALHNF